MSEPTSARVPQAREFLTILLVALAYFVTGRMGLLLADVQANATLIWPPTGLSIAALFLLGPRTAVGVGLGAMVLNYQLGTAALPAAVIACGNTMEALAGWAILKHFGFDASLSRMRDVGTLLAVALVASLVSATVGVGALTVFELVEPSELVSVWSRWWLGDVAGGVIVLPLIIVVACGAPAWKSLYASTESWLVMALLIAGSSAAFLFDVGGLVGKTLPYALFVVLVWAGLRLGPRGAVMAGVLGSILAVIGTAQGCGPFAHPDMSTRILSLWAYVITNGAIVLVLAAAVAERAHAVELVIRAERERSALETQMQHVQRLESLGVLAGGVAHDFNNLLTAVRGNASLISRVKTEEERNTCLEHIDMAAVRASELCQQLLTYAGKAHPKVESVDLKPMTEEIQALLSSSLSKNVNLELDFDDFVPPVSGDPAQLQQIVLNLLMNASEAIGENAGTVWVKTELRSCDRAYLDGSYLPSEAEEGDYVALVVEDTGAGMDEGTMKRVFEPFFSTKFTGRGLGLAAVVGIVNSHGGAIKVSSTPGKGTRFVVLLPPADEAAKRKPNSAASGRHTGYWLVVDDEESVRNVAAPALKSFGCEVQLAKDGDEAIQLLTDRPDDFDGLLVDLTMPGMTGRKVIDWVRVRNATLPIVLMSGYPLIDGDIGDVVYLAKPFSLQELSSAMSSAEKAVNA